MKKLYIIVVVLLCWIAAVNAQTFTVGYLNYSVNDDGISVTVTGHVLGSEATGQLVIPDNVTYNGNTYAVTVVGREAFWKHNGLTGTLIIGKNVTKIGCAAFSLCHGFSGTLNIPNSVVTIDKHAFTDCDGFTGSLIIPNSVDTIGLFAFEQCDGFNGTLTIGSSVVFIGPAAFQLCQNFTNAVSLAAEPPVLESYVFDRFGSSSITVPCGSKTAYEKSDWHGTNGFETIIEDCDNVEELEGMPISVWPNPAADILSLVTTDVRCSSLEIFSLDGRLVKSQNANFNAIDISSLASGLYIIKVRTDDGSECIERIVKE